MRLCTILLRLLFNELFVNGLLSVLETLYDHLDYTRPASSLKAHYQRMKSPFGSKEFVVDTKSETDE